jgi:hypothetical protein
MTRVSATSLALVLAAASAAPTIFWGSDPVGPNQTVIVAGTRLPAAPLVVVNAGTSNHTIKPSQVTATAVKFTLPSDINLAAYSVQVCDDSDNSCSNSLNLNNADLWWTFGDAGNSSTSGGWLRIFGSCLNFADYQVPRTHGLAKLLEEELQHALRSRDIAAITRISSELATALHRRGSSSGSSPQIQLTPMTKADITEPVVLSSKNASMWEAFFELPADLPPGTYLVSYKNDLQTTWTALNAFGGRANPNVRTIIVNSPTKQGKTFKVADYMSKYGIPQGGLNFTTGIPVNGTAAVLDALADARKASGQVAVATLTPHDHSTLTLHSLHIHPPPLMLITTSLILPPTIRGLPM